MKVSVLYRNDPERPLTDPLPEPGKRRFVLRIYLGDYCDPFRDPDGWFGRALPVIIIRVNLPWLPLPFVAWKWPFVNRAAYIGFKLYGVDSDRYKDWLPAHEVFDGSQAVHFSVRPFANIAKEAL